LDSFIIKKPEEWATFSADELYKHLEQINTNSRGISQKPSAKEADGSVQAHAAQVHKQSEKKPCFSFSRTGVCSNGPSCKFSHDAKSSKPEPKSESKVDVAAPVACQNCGDAHQTKACKFSGKCNHCNRTGHKEIFCKSKKAGKPKALLLNADGSAVHANLLLVPDYSEPLSNLLCVDDGGGVPLALTTKADDGTLCEQFFADTGANRHIHPSSKAAASFYRIAFHWYCSRRKGYDI
jgi:hypothetical protein